MKAEEYMKYVKSGIYIQEIDYSSPIVGNTGMSGASGVAGAVGTCGNPEPKYYGTSSSSSFFVGTAKSGTSINSPVIVNSLDEFYNFVGKPNPIDDVEDQNYEEWVEE